MANAYVQVQPDGSGKKVQVFENVVGGQTVEAQAVVQVDPATGLPITTQPVSAASLPLPAGASTEATLAAIKAKTDNLDVALSTRTKPADTQAVSAAALPLPAGAATEATLAGVKVGTDKIPASPATDRSTAAGPFSARLSDGAAFYKATTPADTQPVSGPLTDAQLRASAVPISAASLPLPSGAAQETGGNLATLVARTPALGAAATASSTPVNIANDQTVPVSGTVTTSPPANASTNIAQVNGSTVATSAAGEQKVAAEGLGTSGSPSGGLLTIQGPTAPGSAVTMAPVVIAGKDSLNNTKIPLVFSGSTLAVCPTNSSGTPLQGQLPSASSAPVVIASDQSAVKMKGEIAEGSAIGTPALIAGRDSSGNVLAAGIDANRALLANLQAQVNAQPPSFTNGGQAQLQEDTGGNLRVVDSEVTRQRANLEESRFLAEQVQFLAMRGRSAEVRTSFIDRRGSVGQRGTIR